MRYLLAAVIILFIIFRLRCACKEETPVFKECCLDGKVCSTGDGSGLCDDCPKKEEIVDFKPKWSIRSKIKARNPKNKNKPKLDTRTKTSTAPKKPTKAKKKSVTPRNKKAVVKKK